MELIPGILIGMTTQTLLLLLIGVIFGITFSIKGLGIILFINIFIFLVSLILLASSDY